MPITQTSWLTNLTEDDLAEQLSQNLTNVQSLLVSNNQNIDDIIANYINSVKNDIAVINDKITSLQGDNAVSLIGNTGDGYGTTSSGSVMGKLNYLIYLLAPTPATFNYTSVGTFNNITIPTGVKFISVTACGGSGSGSAGGFYSANNLNSYLYSPMDYLNSRGDYGALSLNSWGRRVTTTYAWNNIDGGCFYDVYKYYTSTYQVAKNIVTGKSAAGATASVVTGSKNVATSEVITVTVGAGGAANSYYAGKAGAASTVTTSNGTITASGGAGGTQNNSFVPSNWVTTATVKYYWYESYNNTRYQNTTNGSATTITVSSGGTTSASANTLGRKGGSSGAGATGTLSVAANGRITLSNGCTYTNRQIFYPTAGAAGGAGYVRVSW